MKAAVIDGDGSLIALAEDSYGPPPVTAANADFDPRRWLDTCRSVVNQVTASVGRAIRAVGIAGQMHGVVLIDGHGRPLRDAVLWPDQRAADVLEDFVHFNDLEPATLGNPIAAGMAGPILVWLGRHEPETLNAATHAVQPKDWLRLRLCGAEASTDPSDASATLLYDIVADGWSDSACASVGVRRALLPRIRPSSSVAAPLHRSVADDLNLDHGVPVVVGAGDAAAALLGAGLEKPGAVLINTGTGAQVLAPLPAPTIADAASTGLNQYRSASDRTPWYAMAAVVNAGLALDWVRRIVGYDWDQLYATARLTLGPHIGEDPTFLPFLSRERDPAATALSGGAWTGLRVGHDRDALARSAVRGVAFYLGLRASALLGRTETSTVVLAGGAVRHRAWVELMADILGQQVAVSADPHLTVRGAARLAARGVGHDLPERPPDHTVEPGTGADVEGPLRAFAAAMKDHNLIASA